MKDLLVYYFHHSAAAKKINLLAISNYFQNFHKEHINSPLRLDLSFGTWFVNNLLGIFTILVQFNWLIHWYNNLTQKINSRPFILWKIIEFAKNFAVFRAANIVKMGLPPFLHTNTCTQSSHYPSLSLVHSVSFARCHFRSKYNSVPEKYSEAEEDRDDLNSMISAWVISIFDRWVVCFDSQGISSQTLNVTSERRAGDNKQYIFPLSSVAQSTSVQSEWFCCDYDRRPHQIVDLGHGNHDGDNDQIVWS